MRKLYAILLLLPLIAFFVGAVRLPIACPMLAKAKCPMMGKMDHRCMMAMRMRHKMDMRIKGRATGNGQSKGSKHDAGCCMDCPVFCVVTFKPLIRFELGQTKIKKEYIVVSDNTLSDYYARHWKPPGGAFVS